MLTVASESSEASDTCILQFYYMARACKYITRAVIGQYSGPDFPVMPTGIVSDVNVRLVTWKYRKCKSTFGSNRWNDLKLNEKTQFLGKLLFLVRYPRGGSSRRFGWGCAVFSQYGLRAQLIRSK